VSAQGLRIGCSGWQYRDWRGVVYPPGLAQRDWLDAYARRFDTVEVNSSFYRLPSRDAVQRWTHQTPDDFVFAVKVSRYLTHVRRLTGVADGMARLAERIEPMAAAGKLGPLLWQLPPQMHRDTARLAAALEELPPGAHAFEFRHESWFVDEVYDLLRAHDVPCVIADDKRRPLPVPPRTGPFVYVRFHYGHRGRGGNYSRTELEEWARRLADVDAGYAYFNNDWNGYAPRNADLLAALLDRSRR
jgi:uncharacterized protein YecE (DUF72 family)